jgi:RNA polymerase sigma-70 factor (ECF subfamily)
MIATDSGAPLSDWAGRWRGPMLRFAQLHLQPREEAEDAVQDALVALLAQTSNQMSNQAPHHQAPADDQLKPYLFGILKHKITDRLRQRYRHGARTESIDDEAFDLELFDAAGHWLPGAAPERWHCPESTLHSEQFFAVVDACLHLLPAKAARVFSMKELLDCDADEVCATLGLSKTDYWQCMSRARKQLQLCLTQKGFDGRGA